MADNKSKIDGTISNLNRVSSDFTKISDSLAKANLGQIVKNLEKTLVNVDKLMSDVQSGKGTFGKVKYGTHILTGEKVIEFKLDRLL